MINIDTQLIASEIANSAEVYIQQATENIVYEQMRPSVVFRPRLFVDGDKWCALYGDSKEDGVAGFGQSPDEAMREFDGEWYKVRKAGE